MQILKIHEHPFSSLSYVNAAPGGGTVLATLPISRAEVDRLPPSIDALLVTSDLQGVVVGAPPDREIALLGCALADHYLALAANDHSLPPADRVGVILAGDLYSAPGGDVRGATGDVRAVWYRFADHFAFVAGVAGNHDLFGTPKERRRFEGEPGIHLIDGTVAEISGLRIGGVSGIIGESAKNERKREDYFLSLLADVLEQQPDFVVLHQGPDGGEGRLRGHSGVRELLAAAAPMLTVCGHAHWPRAMAEPDPGQVTLNVDGRALLLMVQDAAGEGRSSTG